jgi:transposase-like protein
MAGKERKPGSPVRARRRAFTDEFRREAVRMMLDGHSAASIAEQLGLSHANLLYRWKREELERTGPVATSLEARVRELEADLRRVERERGIPKKSVDHIRLARMTDVYGVADGDPPASAAGLARAPH